MFANWEAVINNESLRRIGVGLELIARHGEIYRRRLQSSLIARCEEKVTFIYIQS